MIYMLFVEGGSRLNWETLTALPPSAFELGGGFGNAIVGHPVTEAALLVAGAVKILQDIGVNGTPRTLEIIYREADNTILHFLYK